MIYMIVAALGFATLENIGAISGLTPQAALLPAVFETVSLRFVGATLLHTLTSGVVGYYWAVGIVKGRSNRYLPPGLVIAAILHTTFNYLILTYGDTIYSVILLIIVGFFVLNDFEDIKGKTNKHNRVINFMIMNSEDEKFFEDLSGAKTEADGEYDIELAKSTSGTLSLRPLLPPQLRVQKRFA